MKFLKEDFRIWGDEDIENNNALAAVAEVIIEFLNDNSIDNQGVDYDVHDFGGQILVIEPEGDIEEVAEMLQDEFGFSYEIEDDIIYLDATEEYEDEYGDILTRVTREYLNEAQKYAESMERNITEAAMSAEDKYDSDIIRSILKKLSHPTSYRFPFKPEQIEIIKKYDLDIPYDEEGKYIGHNSWGEVIKNPYSTYMHDKSFSSNPKANLADQARKKSQRALNNTISIGDIQYDTRYHSNPKKTHQELQRDILNQVAKNKTKLNLEFIKAKNKLDVFRDKYNFSKEKLLNYIDNNFENLFYKDIIKDKLIDYVNTGNIQLESLYESLYYNNIENLEEELRIWGDEEISAQNDLVKWEQALEDFNDLEHSIDESIESKNSLKESVDWDYFDKFDPIINKYMPDRGEGETMASQIVTAVNKLIYKWYNDGDVYDNTYILEGWANDLSDYANWLYKYVPKTQYTLDLITEAHNDNSYEEILQLLADLTLDENFLAEYSNKPLEGSIYNCDGPFEFRENYEDDYEDDYYGYDDDDDGDYFESLSNSNDNKIKVGDIVKIVGKHDKSGKIGKVANIDDKYYNIIFNNGNSAYATIDNLELL